MEFSMECSVDSPWNFPWIVYYTASKPLYYEDLFIDIKKLFWTQKDYNSFINNKFKPYTEIINGSSRHELWVDNLKYGKFKIFTVRKRKYR